jgi:lysozyme family protein
MLWYRHSVSVTRMGITAGVKPMADEPFSPQFLACLPFTLAQECPHPNEWSNPRNFSNDAHDPGGETMCGIIQREYTAWRKSNGLPSRDVRYLTQAEGYAIYWRNYWYPECPKLPPGLDLAFFDAAVNEGGHEAILMLQYILGITRDGDWGPETEAHVAAITDPEGMVQAFTKHREDVYRMFKGFRYFDRDWARRSTEIGAEALRMETRNENDEHRNFVRAR